MKATLLGGGGGSWARITSAAVLLGVALRGWAYAADPSFWLDEILLARNILRLPLGHLLTEPLYLDQVAPRGFTGAPDRPCRTISPPSG